MLHTADAYTLLEFIEIIGGLLCAGHLSIAVNRTQVLIL